MTLTVLSTTTTYNDDGIAIMWTYCVIQQLQLVFFWLVFFQRIWLNNKQ